jgi:enoyl-CoA hydratase
VTGTIERSDDSGVVTLTISNPERRNALTHDMYRSLAEHCRQVAGDPTAVAVVIGGAEGHFAGGTDIRELRDLATGEDGVAYEAFIRDSLRPLTELRIPVVGVVQGACVGGGFVIAALCDIVLCTPDARFGSPIARTIGNTLSAASLTRLFALIGRRRTMQLLLTGRLMTATEAVAAGFVTELVADDDLPGRLMEIVEDIRVCSPSSLRSFKELERRIDARSGDVPVDDVFSAVYGGAEFQEGVDAFLGHRRPEFRRIG